MIIFRYLSKEVLVTLFAMTLILLIIFITNQFVHYLNDAAEGKITIQAVMEVMSLQVPIFLGYLLPLGLFLGLLLSLGRLYVDHEMVVLSVCGVSQAKILTMVMVMATIMMLVVAWLMLLVEPKMQWYQGKILRDAVTTASLDKVMPGRFQVLGKNGRVFYAEGVDSDHDMMSNVFLAQKAAGSSGKENWDVVSGDQASELDIVGDGHFLLFKNGFRYIGRPGNLQYDAIQFGQYGIRLNVASVGMDHRIEAIPTAHLWSIQAHDLRAAAELQWRIAMPLSVIVFALLAVPLSHVNPRKGKFAQILPAIIIYIVYANLMFMGRAWISKGTIDPKVGLWWIHGSLFLLAILLLLMQSQWRYVLHFVRGAR